MTEETTALIVKDDLNVSVLFTQDGMQAILDEIRKKIDSFEVDIETDKGRKELKSFAYKITRSKTLLDDIGKELGSDYKKKLDNINRFRKIARDTLDDWKIDIRKPLDEYEAKQEKIKQAKVEAEMKRVESIKTMIADISKHGVIEYGETSDVLKQRISLVENMVIDDKYAEFKEEAKAEKDGALVVLDDALIKRIKFEQEQEEQKKESERLAKQRAEQEEAQRMIDEARKVEEDKLRAEREVIAKEKAKLEADKRAEIERKKREEFERKTQEEARIQAEKEAKEKAEREQREKEQAEIERKKVESLKPDKTKIKGWLLNFEAMIPEEPDFELTTERGEYFFDEIRQDLAQFINDCIKRTESL